MLLEDHQKNNFSSKHRLENALDIAYQWQTQNVGETVTDKKGKRYYGPHKWIVCLLNKKDYKVKNFIAKHKKDFTNQPNLSILIMSLTQSP